MRNLLLFSTILAVPLLSYAAEQQVITYGAELCKSSSDYFCLTTKEGDTWENLWKDAEERDLVQRVNRTNNPLIPNIVLSVPKDLANKSIWDLSPFPKQIRKPGSGKLVIIDQDKLAWGVFDPTGELQWWGPISSGRDKCSDSKNRCRTVTGKYYVFDKKSSDCISKVFPIGEGGAKMPYCMYFYRGFALHGSNNVPGYRDSHGCIRLFTEDAKWLNEKYIDLPTKENNFQGTQVIIKELID